MLIPPLAAFLLLWWCAPAGAEPISASIGLTALIAAGIGGGTAIGGAASLIGATILSVGASLAISAASLALQGSNKQQQLTGGQGVATVDEGVRQPTTAPLPEERLALGSVTSSGALFFRRSDPPYIWRGFLLAAHPCGGLKGLIINGNDVPLDLLGRPLAAPFFDGTTRFVEVSYRPGHPNQLIDPIIARDFPTMPETFRQRGHATVVIRADYGTSDQVHKDVYGSDSVFNPLFRFQGARLIDPRVPGCKIADPDTWVHSSSGSLAIMRALYHQWPNMRLIDPGSINWDLMAAAADIDDRRVGRADGGTEANHTVDGVILSSFDPAAKLRELLTAVDGLLVLRGGKYHVMPGAPTEPIGTLTQGMIAGGFEMHTETPDRDLINTVKTEFVAPDRDYKPSVGPVVAIPALVASDGQALESTLTLPFTEGSARAQRLAMRRLLETRGGSVSTMKRALTASFTVEARRYRAGDVVRLVFPDFPTVDGIWQVRRTSREAAGGPIAMELVSWSNARFAWHAPRDQKPFEIDAAVIAAEAA